MAGQLKEARRQQNLQAVNSATLANEQALEMYIFKLIFILKNHFGNSVTIFKKKKKLKCDVDDVDGNFSVKTFQCRYLPVLMNQAKIYWDQENYMQVEKLFRQSAELCGDADVWRLNVAHTLFMQENKFREATSFYEPLVKQNYDNVITT